MPRNRYLYLVIIAFALAFGVSSCANRTNLKRLKYNKEPEIRKNWKDYTTYKIYRPQRSFQGGAAAFLYKLKDDKKILMDNRWVEVTTEEIKAKTKIWDATISAEIRGQDEELYGYLIYRSQDRPNVKIIDDQTVRIFYHYNQTYSN
jgi:hypothetical protein